MGRHGERLLWAGRLEGTDLILQAGHRPGRLSTNCMLCREVQPHCRWKTCRHGAVALGVSVAHSRPREGGSHRNKPRKYHLWMSPLWPLVL